MVDMVRSSCCPPDEVTNGAVPVRRRDSVGDVDVNFTDFASSLARLALLRDE